jgi:hypothetical protein
MLGSPKCVTVADFFGIRFNNILLSVFGSPKVSSLQILRLKLARISDLDHTCYMPHHPAILNLTLITNGVYKL